MLLLLQRRRVHQERVGILLHFLWLDEKAKIIKDEELQLQLVEFCLREASNLIPFEFRVEMGELMERDISLMRQ
jgi:hypothetical protein